MTDLEKVKNWLLTFPQWEEGGQLYVDYTDAVPGNAGLYPATPACRPYDSVELSFV